MSYIAITSNHPRHREFVSRLQNKIDLSAVFVVRKKEGTSQFYSSELFHFGRSGKLSTWQDKPEPKNIIQCDAVQVNSSTVKRMMKDINPEICFVFGAPLLKKHIFEIPKKGCINIHTGLVQYHRGVDSPYWAIQEGRIDRIGATVHYIDSSIDGGNIIAQSKTKGLSIHDRPEDIFMKTCKTGFDILEENMYNIKNNQTVGKKLLKRGKLYQTKDLDYGTMLEIRYKTPHLLKEYLNGNNS